MNVAIIGGAGRMGRWFINYFLDQGHEITLSDVNQHAAKTVSESTGVKLAKDNIEAVKGAELSVISTPIGVTAKVLMEIAPKLEGSSTVVEISSVKSKVIPVLREIAKHKMKTLSIHPLFGPGIQRLNEEKIALIPVFDPASEKNLATKLFPEAEIIVVDAEEHDRAMALTLSLPHFVNIIFAYIMGEEDLNVLKKLGGTTFTLQLIVSEGVMTEDPSLYASIQIDNEYTSQYLSKFLSGAETLKRYTDKKETENFAQFYQDTRNSLLKDPNFPWAYVRMYKTLEALKNPFSEV